MIISANYTSSTSINISWNPVPESLRLGIITKYIFNLTDVLTGEVTTAVFDGANLHGEATNLSKYREYSITGAAANSKGQSNFTSTVTCRTNEDGERKEWTIFNFNLSFAFFMNTGNDRINVRNVESVSNRPKFSSLLCLYTLPQGSLLTMFFIRLKP